MRIKSERCSASTVKKSCVGWGAADEFMLEQETAAFKAIGLSAYCLELCLYLEQVSQ